MLSNEAIGVIGVIGLLVMVFVGVRVYIAAAVTGLLGLVSILGWSAGAGMAGTIPHSKSISYTLSVLPLFILIGYLAYYARMTRAIFDAGRAWMGWMPGGLAVASVFACAGFGAVSGASTATAAVFSRVAVPEMLRSGYAPSLAAGTIAVGGTLAALIPPSALLVIYAIMVEKSVGQLLIAGFIPGIISVLAYAVIIVVWAMINPSIARPIRGYTWKQRIVSLPKTTPLFGVVGIIFSAMYLGWATPTEAGALGAFLVLIVALLNGMRVLELREAVEETARLTVMIFSLIWGVLIFVRFLGFSGLPQVFTDWIVSLPVSPTVVMIMILLGYVVLGMFMDAIGMMMLTLPIVYPAVIALGYDPIWFGIVVVKMAEICLITPPIGLNCFVVASVRPDIPVNEVFRGSAPFLVAEVVTIGIFLTWPQVITWLPEQALK